MIQLFYDQGITSEKANKIETSSGNHCLMLITHRHIDVPTLPPTVCYIATYHRDHRYYGQIATNSVSQSQMPQNSKCMPCITLASLLSVVIRTPINESQKQNTNHDCGRRVREAPALSDREYGFLDRLPPANVSDSQAETLA